MVLTKLADATDDRSHRTLFKLAKLVDFPQFVKEAEELDTADLSKMPQAVFADPVNRKFPCHTKAATWLSQLYFLESRHLYPTKVANAVQDRITKNAAYFAIEGQTKEAASKWEAHNTPTDFVDDYAMTFEYKGETKHALPINNAENVKAAADRLSNNVQKYPFELRQVAARKILRNASKYEVKLANETEEYLYKAAGYGMTTPDRAAEKLGLRTLMMPKSAGDMRIRMAKLTKSVSQMQEIPLSELTKLANIVDRVDTECGFHHHYAEGVDTPEEIFFELTEKKASTAKDDFIQLTTGSLIPVDSLPDLPLDKIAAAVGEDFLKAIISDGSLDIDITKFARLAPTLPRNDALLLERALQAAGETMDVPSFESLI